MTTRRATGHTGTRTAALTIVGSIAAQVLSSCQAEQPAHPVSPSTVVNTTPAPGSSSKPAQAETSNGTDPDTKAAEVLPLDECLDLPTPTGKAGDWILSEVRYLDGRPSFTPTRFGGIQMSEDGAVVWHDGCNRHWARFTSEAGQEIKIEGHRSTLVGCTGLDDVHLQQSVRLKQEGDKLTLATPSQEYLLKRNKFSELSRSAWSLASIMDRRGGRTQNVDRFRLDSKQLRFTGDKDQAFSFIDLDGKQLSGTLRIGLSRALTIAWDESSQRLIQSRPPRMVHLADASQGYKKTEARFPDSYADQLDWGGVESFCIVEQRQQSGALKLPGAVLQMRGKTSVYTFLQR